MHAHITTRNHTHTRARRQTDTHTYIHCTNDAYTHRDTLHVCTLYFIMKVAVYFTQQYPPYVEKLFDYITGIYWVMIANFSVSLLLLLVSDVASYVHYLMENVPLLLCYKSLTNYDV